MQSISTNAPTAIAVTPDWMVMARLANFREWDSARRPGPARPGPAQQAYRGVNDAIKAVLDAIMRPSRP